MRLLIRNPINRLFLGIALSLSLLFLPLRSAGAWDIWLVTTQNRILVIRDVDTNPHQELAFIHDDIPDAHTRFGYFGLGDIGFTPTGGLYGISISLQQKSHLYIIDPTTGHVTQLTPELPFEWGTGLEFDLRRNQGYIGGGLESYNPYEYSHGLYAMTNGDPATAFLWHDMRSDYPSGGWDGGYTQAGPYLYTLWGVGNWNQYSTYLLQITTDSAGNFVSYTNLGAAETHGVPPGSKSSLVGISSDGAHLYAVSASSLYQVTISNGVATYTKMMDFSLQPDEMVNGSSAKIADLSVTLTSSTTTPVLSVPFQIAVRVRNAGPFESYNTIAQVELPSSVIVDSIDPTVGSFDPATGQWALGTLFPTQSATLMLTVRATTPGTFTASAEIIHAGATDPDSIASVGYDTDDWEDGQPDDDEATLSLSIPSPTSTPTPIPPTSTPTPTPLPPTSTPTPLPPTSTPTPLPPTPTSTPTSTPTPTLTPTLTPTPVRQMPETGFPRNHFSSRKHPIPFIFSADQRLISPWLEIPSIGVKANIMEVPEVKGNWDVSWLGSNVGWLEGSAFPTWPGNTVLTGHVWNADNKPGVFVHLKDLRYGDEVILHAWGLAYLYAVTDSERVDANDFAELLVPKRRDWLTLVTCEGYDTQSGLYLYRRIVRAVLVKVTPEESP